MGKKKPKEPTWAALLARQKKWFFLTDPTKQYLSCWGGASSDRKLRLISSVCCYSSWHFARDARPPRPENTPEGKVKAHSRELARERSYRVSTAELNDVQQCLGFKICGRQTTSSTVK